MQLLLVEARELETKMNEFRSGLREQVDSILSTPYPNTSANTTPSTPQPATVSDLIDLSNTL